MIEIQYLVSGTEIDVFWNEAAGAESLYNGTRPAAGYYGHRIFMEDGHSYAERILGAESAEQFPVQVAKDSSISENAVNVESKSLDLGKIHVRYDLAPLLNGGKSPRLKVLPLSR